MTGVMSVIGHPGQEPVKSSVPLADLGAGLFAAYGILSAVIGRGLTGEGQFIDASLFETALGLSIWESAEYWGTGELPVPIGSANRMSAPYQAVRASDGHFVIGAANPKLWTALCGVIDRADLLQDARFTDNVLRIRNREVLIAELERELRAPHGRRVGRCAARRRRACRPDLRLRRGARERAGGGAQHGDEDRSTRWRARSRALGFPVKLSGTPQQVRHPAPLLGQHTDEILAEIGMTAARIDALRQSGAFGAARNA